MFQNAKQLHSTIVPNDLQGDMMVLIEDGSINMKAEAAGQTKTLKSCWIPQAPLLDGSRTALWVT